MCQLGLRISFSSRIIEAKFGSKQVDPKWFKHLELDSFLEVKNHHHCLVEMRFEVVKLLLLLRHLVIDL